MDSHHQVDLILLDFTKAFDTVPHKHLLTKLHYYGNYGPLHNWINVWLTRRYQKVIIEGESSRDIEVYSSVPQGTVLGPLMFLICINDIASYMTSTCRLFADDCITYRSIESKTIASVYKMI